VKVCDKTCIFCFFPIINKYLCLAKRSLLSEQPSYFNMVDILPVYVIVKSGISPSFVVIRYASLLC